MHPNHRQQTTETAIPNRIDTAFRALAYVQSVKMGGVMITPQGRRVISSRTLTPPETALHNMAAETIRHYIGGEIDLAGEFVDEQNARADPDDDANAFGESDDDEIPADDATDEPTDEPTDDSPF